MQELICYSFTCAGLFLMAFIAFFNPAGVNSVANKWFSLFLFALGCMLLETIIYQFTDPGKYSRLIAFTELSRFAMAPALYLSVLHFTLPDKSFKKKEYLHFIPFGLFFACASPALFNIPVHVFPAKGHGMSAAFAWLVFISVKVQFAAYWIACYYRLNRHQRNIRLINSSIKPINLSWLRFLLLVIVGMIILWFNQLFFHIVVLSVFLPFGCVIALLLISYFLLAQKEIYPFDDKELKEINTIIQNDTKPVESKARFAGEQVKVLKSRIVALMEDEKVYLDNELSLPQLAKMMNISTHDLSYLLNHGFNKNFFQFVNAYRVQEAKRLMLSDKYKHLNILGIAYSSGFNSKTTFNISFKKETDLSPTQFLQQHKGKMVPPALQS